MFYAMHCDEKQHDQNIHPINPIEFTNNAIEYATLVRVKLRDTREK
jgi:hypothetical protein